MNVLEVVIQLGNEDKTKNNNNNNVHFSLQGCLPPHSIPPSSLPASFPVSLSSSFLYFILAARFLRLLSFLNCLENVPRPFPCLSLLPWRLHWRKKDSNNKNGETYCRLPRVILSASLRRFSLARICQWAFESVFVFVSEFVLTDEFVTSH